MPGPDTAASMDERLQERLRLDASSPPVWLRVGKLFDGERVLPGRAAHLVFDARGIRHVGSDGAPPAREALRPGQTGPDADLPDHVALPGLIEAHAHLFLRGGELSLEARRSQQSLPPAALLEEAEARLRALPAIGVVAVRDAGDRAGVGLALASRRRPPAGPKLPYLDSPGAAIHRRGRYGSFLGLPFEDHGSPEDCVRSRVADGAERIKVIATGIIDFKTGSVVSPPQFDAATLRRLADAARAHGLQTFAHATGAEGIQNVIDAGLDSVEHGFFITPEQLKALRDRDIAWVPTFIPVEKQVRHAALLGWSEEIVRRLQGILDGHGERLRQAAALGVKVVAGSDAGSQGVAHGLDFLGELEIMEAEGLSPLEVLRAATGTPAGRLGLREPCGRLAAGWRARIILTRHDPLETVRALREPKLCLLDGEVFPFLPPQAEGCL